MIPAIREEAVAAGRAASLGAVPLHDLSGQMAAIGVPADLRQGRYASERTVQRPSTIPLAA